jgi:hypothetical protein
MVTTLCWCVCARACMRACIMLGAELRKTKMGENQCDAEGGGRTASFGVGC